MISLQNILSTEGQEFFDNLLNKEIVVTEKLNAATLSFKKKISSEMDMNRSLTFYKGSGVNKREITVADRVMTNFYSLGMTHLSNLSKIIIDKIPGNWTFVCKYFPNHQPSFINYSVLPKNHLVLSCIITNGGTKIEEPEDLISWAEMFDIAYQEPVFKGYLSEYQKEKLSDYIKDNTNSNKDSFAKFIITLLNPSLTHSLYQNDGFDSPIDGFIFKFVSDDGITKPLSAKLIDPYMTNLILKNKSTKGFKDNTDVLLSDFTIFMTSQDMDSIILHGDDEEQRYLELFYKLFNRYIKYKKEQLEDFDVDTNDVVKESINVDFDVNIKEISNETTKKLLKDNPEYKSIFKALLGSFKSKKSNEYKSLVMSPGVVRLFNDVVDKINNKISNKDDGNSLSFSDYISKIHKDTNIEINTNQASDTTIIKPQELEIKHPTGQALSFADFKKKDEKEDDDKKEIKKLKSIEDMIKDLKKDMSKIKDEVKEVTKKQDDKKEESEEEDKPKEKSEKKDEKSSEPEEKENDKKEEDNSSDEPEEETKDSDENGDDEDKEDEKSKNDDNPLSKL